MPKAISNIKHTGGTIPAGEEVDRELFTDEQWARLLVVGAVEEDKSESTEEAPSLEGELPPKTEEVPQVAEVSLSDAILAAQVGGDKTPTGAEEGDDSE